MSEINYKVKFSERYFDSKLCIFDENLIDIMLINKKHEPILYIESKITLNETQRDQALAQIVLTNKRQKHILNKLALIYKDNGDDVLELINITDDSVMFNNDFNWKAETPSNPSRDAIDRINDRIKGLLSVYKNDEIKELYKQLLEGNNLQIEISTSNFISIYYAWKAQIAFKDEIKDEQILINLFLVDILKGQDYRDNEIFFGHEDKTQKKQLIREGADLGRYTLEILDNKVRIIYDERIIYLVPDIESYNAFWQKYKRPPEKSQFLEILEHSNLLYTDKYRKDTGGEYTPFYFVKLQNEILESYFIESETKLEDYIVYDPCCGVGNLENQFGLDFKKSCYLSTLDSKDVGICKIKGFDNVVCFDYLQNGCEPLFKHNGKEAKIKEIAARENKKLMVIMNPPYQQERGKCNKAIQFFKKILKLEPSVIVFYYRTESFFRDELEHYINSGYKMYSHIFSNAKTTFGLSEWSISQMIFTKDKGKEMQDSHFSATRYEYHEKQDSFKKIKRYKYDLKRPSLLKELKKTIKEHEYGMVLGQYSHLLSTIVISNGGLEKNDKITTQNLKYCLLSKGINFNTHHKYFEFNDYVLKGKVKKIPQELFNDSIAFSLFYKGNLFSNKPTNTTTKEGIKVELRNFIMPFTAEELGGRCIHNDLNVLYPDETDIIKRSGGIFKSGEIEAIEKPFDFREFLRQFDFSREAKDLFAAALNIFRYYHANFKDTDFNDSFYDISNAIMGKDIYSYKMLENIKETRITKVKTTKNTKGFGRNTIRYAVPSKDLETFIHFFDVRDILARKINKQLLDSNILLWERENIY